MFTSLNRILAPTEAAATALLWVIAGIAIGLALWGSPTAKAFGAGWFILP